MRLRFLLHFSQLALWALFCAQPFQLVAAGKLQTIPLYGERYVSLTKWAASKGFKVRWDVRDKSVEVTNRWARLSLAVDSRRAEINGIDVWLSAAISANNGALFIGDKDLKTLIEPVLYPPKGKVVKTVAISAGHGGKDPGFQLKSQQEKKYTLLLARAVRDALAGTGLKVVMIRETDVYHDPKEQAARANRARADLFISLHYNSASDPTARGFETYCLTPAGATPTNGGRERSKWSSGNKYDSLNAVFGYEVQKAVLRDTGMADRGLRRAGFMMLRHITMPGILIEGGFMSNPADARKIYDARQRKIMAEAIVDGILAYKRIIERK